MTAFATAPAAIASLTGPRPVTLATARAAFARLGMNLRKTEYDEYRVNFRHGEEATAAYESSLPDAIGTGLAMLAHKARLGRELRAMGVPADMAARDALAAVSGQY